MKGNVFDYQKRDPSKLAVILGYSVAVSVALCVIATAMALVFKVVSWSVLGCGV